jgi:hypothetical protein
MKGGVGIFFGTGHSIGEGLTPFHRIDGGCPESPGFFQ